MTAIAGLVDNGKIYMGGDSAGSAGYFLQTRRDPKVFVTGDYIIGFTSSFRMGDLLRYSFKPPKAPAGPALDHFMRTKFIDALRKCLKDGGYASKTNETESAGTFLVGIAGRLFKVENDYQVAESADDYDACGSGQTAVLAAFYALNESLTLRPQARVRIALEAAAKFNSGVRGPFTVEYQ